MTAGACIHCNRHERDAGGTIKHEAYCPMFMRGPDAGGDPAEWTTIDDAIAELAPAPEQRNGHRHSVGDSVYVAGKHYEVIELVEQDGAPALRLKNVRSGQPLKVLVREDKINGGRGRTIGGRF